MNMNMNRLPVPTWNHLGVNFAPDKAALPQVPANGWGTAAATAAVPAGIRTNGPETEIFETFTESGMGVAADAFLAANANVKEHLAVGEGVAIETPAVFEVKLDEAHPCALSCLTIDAAKGSSLTVVQVLRGDAEDGVAASLVRINAAEGAHVKLVQVQLLGRCCHPAGRQFPGGAGAHRAGRQGLRLRHPHVAGPQQERVRPGRRLLRTRQ